MVINDEINSQILYFRGIVGSNPLQVWVSTPLYFVVVNLHSLKGVITVMRGRTQVTWSSSRVSGAVGKNIKSDSGKAGICGH